MNNNVQWDRNDINEANKMGFVLQDEGGKLVIKALPGSTQFKTDSDASDFVRDMALMGDDTCERALQAMHESEHGPMPSHAHATLGAMEGEAFATQSPLAVDPDDYPEENSPQISDQVLPSEVDEELIDQDE